LITSTSVPTSASAFANPSTRLSKSSLVTSQGPERAENRDGEPDQSDEEAELEDERQAPAPEVAAGVLPSELVSALAHVLSEVSPSGS